MTTHKIVAPSGGIPMAGAPEHKVVPGGGPVLGGPVLGGKKQDIFEPLPDWWAVMQGLASQFDSPILFPLSNGAAPGALLPVAYGAVRVGGTSIFDYSPMSNDLISGGRLIVWCEGEIQSIDSLVCDGQTLTMLHLADTGSLSSREWTNYGNGANWTYGSYHANIVEAAFTDIQLYRSPVLGARWWLLLPNGAQDHPWEWAADIHGLKVYDPRLDSTNGGSGSQRYTDPSTWAYSNNPVLETRDLLRRYGRLTPAEIDDVSFAAAATAAESAGFTCNIVWTQKTALRDALGAVLQTCNGKLIEANGKTGIYLDIPQAGAPVMTLLEEDGDIFGLKYEWLSARSRYTRVAVSFLNSASNYKQDQTPDFDDPGIAAGTVPIRPIVVNAPGVNTLTAAVILRDYIFNAGAINFRISGTMNTRGITLNEGQKIHLVTLKGVDVDCLIVQISGDQNGFFQFVAKPYVAGVYGTVPLSQGPPVVTPPPNPTTPGQDIVVTDASTTRRGPPASSSNTTVYDLYQLIKYTLPTTGPALKELRVRGFAGTGALSKTWDDMAGSDIVIPLTGNEPPPDASHFMLSHPGVIKTIETLTFAVDGQLIQTVDATGPTRIIIKTVTTADALSTGVTVDVAQSTNTVTNPRTDVPLWKRVKSTTPANGSTKVFAIPTKPVLSTLSVIVDGQFLVATGDSPVEGADYSVSGLNVTIDAARAAPLSYVLFIYQESVEP